MLSGDAQAPPGGDPEPDTDADPDADTDALVPVVYEDLRRMAAAFFQREAQGQTLQPTALVHEVYMRLADQEQQAWSNRPHFLAIAARAMRRVLVDAGRSRKADRRGGNLHRVTLTDHAHADPTLAVDLVDLGEALEKLGEVRPRSLEIVELRYFAGLGFEETAKALGVSESAVAKEWRLGRAYLSRYLGESDKDSSAG